MALDWRATGANAKGLLDSVLTGASNIITGIGQNAQANAANNKAIAGANAQAPDIIKQQLAAQEAKEARQEKILMYSGIGAAIIIALFIILLIILKKRKA